MPRAVALRFVEDRATVAGYRHATRGPASGLAIGDVIVAVDGAPVERLVEEWRLYYPASNEPARLNRMAMFVLRGACESTELRIRRGARELDVHAERIPGAEIDYRVLATHDKPGDTFQWLTDDVAYVKLSTIRQADVPGYLEALQRASGLGVFYPDGSPTQRIGIVPDVVVSPTIEGIRSGRDEVLEAALREISARADQSPSRP